MATNIASRVRDARQRIGVSQERFAEVLGTSRRNVMRWEGGYTKPSPEYRRRIAEVTGSDPSDFEDDEAEDD